MCNQYTPWKEMCFTEREYWLVIYMGNLFSLLAQSGWHPSQETEQHSRPAARDRERDSAPAASQIRNPSQRKKQPTNLVQGDEHPDQKLLVLRLEGKSKAIDYAAQDLQQLPHPVKVLCLVNKPKQARLKSGKYCNIASIQLKINQIKFWKSVKGGGQKGALLVVFYYQQVWRPPPRPK